MQIQTIRQQSKEGTGSVYRVTSGYPRVCLFWLGRSFNHRFSCFVKEIFILEFVAWKSVRVFICVYNRKIFGFDRDYWEEFSFSKWINNKKIGLFIVVSIWDNLEFRVLLKIVLFRSALKFAVNRDACVLFENFLDFRIFKIFGFDGDVIERNLIFRQ